MKQKFAKIALKLLNVTDKAKEAGRDYANDHPCMWQHKYKLLEIWKIAGLNIECELECTKCGEYKHKVLKNSSTISTLQGVRRILIKNKIEFDNQYINEKCTFCRDYSVPQPKRERPSTFHRTTISEQQPLGVFTSAMPFNYATSCSWIDESDDEDYVGTSYSIGRPRVKQPTMIGGSSSY